MSAPAVVFSEQGGEVADAASLTTADRAAIARARRMLDRFEQHPDEIRRDVALALVEAAKAIAGVD